MLRHAGRIAMLGACALASACGRIAPIPELVVVGSTASPIAFLAPQEGPPPDVQTVTLQNVGGGVLSGLSAVARYPEGPTNWLTATVEERPPFYQVTLRATPGGLLPAGQYSAELAVVVRDTDLATLPVTLTVRGPALDLDQQGVQFTVTLGGSAPAQVIQAADPLGGALPAPSVDVTYVRGTGWLSAAASSDGPPYAIQLQADATGLALGDYLAVAIVTSAGADSSPQVMTVRLTVTPWGLTGELPDDFERFGQRTATALPDGRIFVVGGTLTSTSAALYDPASDTWTAAPPPALPRSGHTATLLRDGRVFVAGGLPEHFGPGLPSTTWEIFDPGAGTWSASGGLLTDHEGHSATLLADGRVLLAGGGSRGPDNADGVPRWDTAHQAEVFDPATQRTSATGLMAFQHLDKTYPFNPRGPGSAVLLPNGKVLVAGGVDDASSAYVSGAEIFDPVTGLWSPTSPLPLARAAHALALLPNGKVLAAGGYGIAAQSAGPVKLTSTALYDPATGAWTSGPPLPAADYALAAVALPSGKIMVLGESVQVYDPATAVWTHVHALRLGGQNMTAVLAGGVPMVVGGYGLLSTGGHPTAEIWRAALP